MQPRPKTITVAILTYNGESFLEDLFRSLEAQSSRDFQVLVFDNASSDTTVASTNVLRQKTSFHVEVVTNEKNDGFARGFNQAISHVQSPYVLVTNQDLLFHETCIAELIQAVDRHPKAYALGPKVNRYPEKGIIDTTGIQAFPNGRMLNRGEGEEDHGQYEAEERVFGIAGTLLLLKTASFPKISKDGYEVFDEWFFMYKEDTDLAWRAFREGMEAWYIPSAVAFHQRSAKKSEGLSDATSILSRRTKPAWQRYYATRNHWAMLAKNRPFRDPFSSKSILLFEAKKIAYMCVFEPVILGKAALSILKDLPRLREKRRQNNILASS